MSTQVRVGIIGTSGYADFMHLPTFKSHPQAQLTAICGRNLVRAQEIAAKHDVAQVFTDYREMIEQGGLDAVVVSTPDDWHYPMTMAALDKGLHVLCEKPLALTAQQAKEMAEKAESVGVKHMTYFTLRWQPYARYLAYLIEEGYLGRFYHGHFRYFGNYGRSANYQWKWDKKRGLGILGDLGSHMIDSARWYLGEISAVSAQLSNFVDRKHEDGRSVIPTNDSALLNLKFQNGGQGMIHVSAVAHLGKRGSEQQILLHGEEGTLELEFNFGGHSVLRGARKDEDEIQELAIPKGFLQGVNWDAPIISQWQHVFTHHAAGGRAFIDAITNDLPISPNFFDGWQTQKVIEAAFESERLGTWISLIKA